MIPRACDCKEDITNAPQLPIVCMAVALTGCMVGPNYKRPAVPAPPQFRAGESQPTQASLGDAKWFDIFQDERSAT